MAFYLKVAGVTHNGRQRVLRQLVPGQPLKFEAEPNNPYDSNAVKVNTLDGINVGYVKRSENYQISKNLRTRAGEYTVSVASISGGGFDSFYGCNILVDYHPTQNSLQNHKGDSPSVPRQELDAVLDDDDDNYIEPEFRTENDSQMYQCVNCSSIFNGRHARQSWHWSGKCPYCFAPSSLICDFSPISVGKVIKFGHYPQEISDIVYQPIQWIVLSTDKTEGVEYATLLSKKVLDIRPIDTATFGWKDCCLRKWLNHDFFEKAFTDAEQRQLLTYQKENPTTIDRVWVPDNSQVNLLEQVLKDELVANATRRVEQKFSLTTKTIGWWLSEIDRFCFPQDYDLSKRAYISETGHYENAEGDAFLGIRPIIAISFNAPF